MLFRKLFYLFGIVISVGLGESQFMPGSQEDPSGHGCVLDGGYQWCEEMNACVRSWEENCPSLNHIMIPVGPGPGPVRPIDPLPVDPLPFPSGNGAPTQGSSVPSDCATWNDGCNICRRTPEDMSSGNYPSACTEMMCFRQATPFCMAYLDGRTCTSVNDCVDTRVDECFAPCPPPAPCPMPYMSDMNMNNCKMVTNNDNCGCVIGCPHYDCTNDNCNSDIDCQRDQFCRSMNMRLPMANGRRGVQGSLSECVDKAGINESCGGYTPPEYQTRCLDNLECVNTMGPMIADAPGQCKELCDPGIRRDDHGNCLTEDSIPTIPDNCATWFDGCNTCQVTDGKANICTLMYCYQPAKTYCMNYHIQQNSLEIGDVCYRFCEGGSQDPVNRRSDCPTNTVCKSLFNEQSESMIAFDSCDNRAWTCELEGH